MYRPIVQCGVCAIVLVTAMPSPSWAQSTPSASGTPTGSTATVTATSTPTPTTGSVAAAETEAAPQPPRCKFDDLLQVEVRDRKLAVAMTPPKSLEAEILAGGSAPITVVDSDAIDWRISGTRNGGGAAAAGRVRDAKNNNNDDGGGGGGGGFARFAIAPPPDYMPDRWSPLQLTSVLAEDELSILGSGRVGRTFVSVQYRQDQARNAVRLKIERSRRPGNGGRPLHDFTAPDLLQLWNDHQRECRLYLLPLLNAIAPRANLLRPRAGDVYRVFTDIPANAEMAKRVAAILPELEADTPTARDAASAKIEALGAPAVLALLRMDRAEWTPEQTARLATIVQRQSTLTDPAAWGRDIYFLTDCLDDPDPAVRQAALVSVSAIAGREVDFDLDAGSQARLAAAQEILRTLESTTAAGR